MTVWLRWIRKRVSTLRGNRKSTFRALLIFGGTAVLSYLGVLAREIFLDTTIGAVYDRIREAPFIVQLVAVAALITGTVAGLKPWLLRRRPQADVTETPDNPLPPALTPFLGREADLDDLVALLGPPTDAPHKATVVAVVGWRGVGTSALAVHVTHRIADQFPDGVVYLDFRGPATESALTRESALYLVMHQVGLAEPRSRRPHDLDEAVKRLQRWLATRRLLLLLDNIDDPEQVRSLLPRGPDCRAVLAGGVDLEKLSGVHVHRLRELSEPAAVRLLSAVSGRALATQDAQAATALVNECGRQPLAIRLLGQLLRDRGWPLSHVVEVMQRAARTSPYAPEPEELGSLRQVWDACDVTYRDMSAEHRRLFRLLAVVPTIEIGRNAAAAVAGLPPERATRLLEELARRGLVESARPGYYRIRQLLTSSARFRLDHENSRRQLNRARLRLVRYYALLAEQYAEPLLLLQRRAGGDVPGGISNTKGHRWFRREHETLLRLVTSPAMAPSAPPTGEQYPAALTRWLWRLAVGLCTWYATEGRLDAWEEVCRAILDRATLDMAATRGRWARLAAVRRVSPTDVAFWAHNELGVLHRLRGNTDAAFATLQTASRLARGRHRRGLAQAQTNLGLALIDQEQLDLAMRYLEEGLALRSRSDHRGRAISALGLGTACLHAGELDAARRHLSHAANEFDLLGDKRGSAASLNALGLVLAEQDDQLGTEEHWELARQRYAEAGDDLGVASVLLNTGAYLIRPGPDPVARAAQARDILTESLRLRAGQPETRYTALAYLHLASASALCGDHDAAQHHRREAARLLVRPSAASPA